MPVPNTNTFSLQDVVDEISGTQTSLVECFAEANESGFDPVYEGDKDELSNFRNYDDDVDVTYYRLINCEGGANAFTTINPNNVFNQRYINPPSQFYTWNGTVLIAATPPTGFNGNIQRINGQTGCP